MDFNAEFAVAREAHPSFLARSVCHEGRLQRNSIQERQKWMQERDCSVGPGFAFGDGKVRF